MLAVGYPVRGQLKNYSCKREKVTAVTEFEEGLVQNSRANGQTISCRGLDRRALGLDRQLAPNGEPRPALSGSGSGAGRSFTCLPT
jgi:hypothetical protein